MRASTPPILKSGNRCSRKWFFLVFMFLLAWQIVLVWIFPHFATQDGPSHLYNATLIRSLHDPAWHRASEFYHLNSRLVPNWFTYAVLVSLYSLFSPATSEKILVTGYFILLPLSFTYVLRTITRNGGLFAIWGLVLANNYFIAAGFYNFCYSLMFFLLCLGYWMRWRDSFRLKQIATLSVLGTLLYFSHAVGFFMAALFIGVLALSFGLAEWRYSAVDADRQMAHKISAFLKQVLMPQLAFLPCLGFFFVASIGSQPETTPYVRTLAQRLAILHEFYVLVDTRDVLGIVRVCLVASFLLWGFYVAIANSKKQHKLTACDGLGFLAVICLSVYIVLPWSIAGGGMIPERMAWFGLCGSLLWLSSKEWTINARWVVRGISTLVVVLGLISQTGWRHQLSPMLNAYDEAGRLLVPQKTILSLCYCDPEGNPTPLLVRLRPRVFDHAGDLAALRGRALSIDNYEAEGSSFPVEYIPRVNPALKAKSWETTTAPQITDIADYESQTGKAIDYVLIWGPGPDDSVESESILDRQLHSNYEVIYTSSAPALLRLLRRR